MTGRRTCTERRLQIVGRRFCHALALLLALAAAAPLDGQSPGYSNPVMPGDHPDPSIIRVGSEYWATATTSQWAPIFPLLHSSDLVNWRVEGAVFEEPPAWSSGSYWAPEIAEHQGRFFVYYSARKKNGPLCVAVATAARPGGPWTDHGPLVCQEAGSIDAAPVTAEDGRRYLVWKEDGNSRKLPTPLWAQPLSDDGTALEGKATEILRNAAPWEGHLVEGPFILRHDGWFYLFYSAGGCCGRTCDYRLGVARSRTILGEWERNPANPILSGNQYWKCPGHGSVVTLRDGRTFLLYHAYQPDDFEYAGRQALLDEVAWHEGWPSINGGRGPSMQASAPVGVREHERPAAAVDEFDKAELDPRWQWPWDRTPRRSFQGGILTLRASGRDAANPADTVVARPAIAGDYVATVRVLPPSDPAGFAGLSVYGNPANALGVSLSGARVILWRREKGVQQTLATADAMNGRAVQLRVTAVGGSRFQFAMSSDGRAWLPIGGDTAGGYLPPWDLAVRIALAVGGPEGSGGRFDWVRIRSEAHTASASAR
jgi:xylan 1,4-beta-xylosidase